jgi:tetratricopeptide (TPR) repeat protein
MRLCLTALVAASIAATARGRSRAFAVEKAAKTHFDAGRLQEALAAYERAIELGAPVRAEAELGNTLIMLRRPHEALSRLEGALARRPDHPSVHLYAGLATVNLPFPSEDEAALAASASARLERSLALHHFMGTRTGNVLPLLPSERTKRSARWRELLRRADRPPHPWANVLVDGPRVADDGLQRAEVKLRIFRDQFAWLAGTPEGRETLALEARSAARPPLSAERYASDLAETFGLLAQDYAAALDVVRRARAQGADRGAVRALNAAASAWPAPRRARIFGTWLRAFWWPSALAAQGCGGAGASCLGPGLSPIPSSPASGRPRWPRRGMARAWRRRGMIVVDDALSAGAVAALRGFARAHLWHAPKPTYVMSSARRGFAPSALWLAAREVRAALPEALCDLALDNAWAVVYDHDGPWASGPVGTLEQQGVNVHADDAGVTVNVWLTPDEANVASGDEASGRVGERAGGLVVYHRETPADWSRDKFNNQGFGAEARAWLERESAERTTVPYRHNRMIVFKSFLLHETDAMSFRPGWGNRRVSLTMVFGQHGERCPEGGNAASGTEGELASGSLPATIRVGNDTFDRGEWEEL